MDNIKPAFERFFRLYYKLCNQPDEDTIFSLLNATHSLNDKLNNSINENFFDSDEFIAIKALRNLFHHHCEVVSKLKIIPAAQMPEITTDVLYLCLVPRLLVEKSFEYISPKYRKEQEKIIQSTLKWYGNVVNIYPCLFNFSVTVFEKTKKNRNRVG